MKDLLTVAVCCCFCLATIVVAAPQDTQTGIRRDTTKRYLRVHPAGNVAKEPLEDNETITLEERAEAESDTVVRRDEPQPTIEEQSSTQRPAGEAVTPESEIGTPATITITRPTKKPNKKPKPVRATTTTTTTLATTAKPLVQTTVTEATASPTSPPTRRYPCRCGGGLCSCCTGIILENFNVPFRSKACANVTYEPDDFAFNFKLLYNDRLLYNNRLSAKNPPPACITVNRFFGVKMCAKMTNVFLSGRNVHACLEFEGFWDGEPAFNYPFNCFRFGSEGVAFVRPEDGGGLPPPPDEEDQTDEEYDDNARGWTGDVVEVPN